MATFKVGQRVRIVNPASRLCGREAIVLDVKSDYLIETFGGRVQRVSMAYRVGVDGYGNTAHGSGRRLAYTAEDLAPLTDPKADQFIEWVKKIKPEPVAVPVAELQRVK